ncbi:MAG: hypothetical protein PQJ59_15420 [Spirochaetales bacterium]|nr:hypothetical protein [Spirochaetales bacterium]
MKRLLFITTLTTLLATGALFADTGLGAAFTYGYDNDNESMNSGGALTINTPAFPGTVQTIKLGFNGSDYINFNLSDDWWVIQENLTGLLDIYIGLGFNAGFTIDDDEWDINLGGRVPVGLTIKPIEYMEFFMEVAPTMGLGFEPEIYFPSWSVQGALGFRLWF